MFNSFRFAIPALAIVGLLIAPTPEAEAQTNCLAAGTAANDDPAAPDDRLPAIVVYESFNACISANVSLAEVAGPDTGAPDRLRIALPDEGVAGGSYAADDGNYARIWAVNQSNATTPVDAICSGATITRTTTPNNFLDIELGIGASCELRAETTLSSGLLTYIATLTRVDAEDYTLSAGTLYGGDFGGTPPALPDATAPRVASIERQTPTTESTSADSLTWRVTFDEAVAFTPDRAAIPYALTNTDNVADAGALELYRAQVSATAEVNGTTYLFVGSPNDDGVSVFSVANDGTLTNVENVADDGTLYLGGLASLTSAEVNGIDYLFAGGGQERGISVFSIANDGTLTNVDNVADDATLYLDEANAAAAAQVNGTTYLFAGGNGGGVSVFSVANDGSLTNVDNVADDATLNLAFFRTITTAVVNGTTYVFVASITDDGISVFSVANDGTLTNVDNVADDATLELLDAFSATTAEVNGTTYLFVAGYADDGISVFSVASNGALTNVFNITDSGALELNAVRSIATVSVNGLTYLFAVGFSDNGMSVFSVANDGSLTNVDNVADDATLSIAFPTSVTTAAVNDTSFVFVTGFSDDGVSGFQVTPAQPEIINFDIAGTTAALSSNVFSPTVVDVTASGGDLAGANASATLSFNAGQTFADLAGNALTDTTPTGTNNDSFDVDNSPPIVTDIFANNNATAAATLITWFVSINEDPSNLTIDDFTLVTTGTATGSNLQIAADNGTNVNVTANLTGVGTAELEFDANTDIVDQQGNGNGTNGFAPANTTDPNAVASVDTVAPSVVSITGPSSPTNSDTASWRVTLSENVTGAANGSFTVSGTTAGPVLVNTLDNIIDILVTGGDLASLDGDITLALTGAHGITDIAGNPLASLVPSGTDERTVTIDNTAPLITGLARNNPATTNLDSVSWHMAFDSAMQNLGAADFQISGTTATLSVTPLNPAEFTITASGGDLAGLNGDITLSVNPAHDLTDAAGNALTNLVSVFAPNEPTYTIDNTVPPTFTKVFAPDSIAAGGSSTLTFTIDSSANGVAATALDFTDNFPAGMTVATPANASTTCTGGTVTAVSGAGTVSYTGGSVGAGATCTVSVDVTSSTVGNAVNTTGDLTSSLGNSGTATDTLTITDATPPRVASILRQNPTDETTSADSLTWRVTFSEDVTAPSSLANRSNSPDAFDIVLGNNYDLEFIEIAGSTYLFNAALGDDGVSTLGVDAAGNVTVLGSIQDDATLFLDGAHRVETAVVAGTPYLFVGSYYENGISVFSIGNDGALTNVDNVADSGAMHLTVVSGLHAVAVNGTPYLYAAGETDDGVSVFSVAANGQLTNIQNISDDGTLELNGPGGMTSAVIGGTTYLFVSGRHDDGISVFSIGNDGLLTNVANQDDSASNLNGAEGLATAVINGTTYLFVASGVSDAISAYSVGNDGSLALAHSIADTAELLLDQATKVSAIELDGTIYVVVAARRDNAVSVFSVANDGTMTPATSVAQSANAAFELTGLASLAAQDIGGSAIVVTGDTNGISAFELLTPGIGSSDFAIDDPAASLAVNAVSASVYDVTASGASIATGNAVRTLSFAGDQSIQDLAGNALANTEPTGANQNEFDLDNAPPIVTDIFANNNATIGNTLVTWFISINEDPDNFTIDDFTLVTSAGVTASNLQISQDGGTNAQITANLTGTGTAQLQFNANTDIVDALGNGNGTNGFAPANTTDPNSSIVVDTVAPRLVSITRETPAGEQTNADALVFDVRFDTPVTGVEAADFAISGTTAGLTVAPVVEALPPGIEAAAAPLPATSSWRVTASGGNLAGLNTTVSLALDAAASIVDANGNALTDRTATGAVETYDVRNTPPAIASIVRLTPVDAITNADSLTWRLTFSQIDNTFALPTNAFTVTGTSGGVTDVSRFSIGFDVTVSGGDLAALNGDVTLGLTNADFTDDYGNVMDRTIPAGAELSYTVDNAAPVLTAFARNTPASEQTDADSLVFSINFNESVANVSADDFVISGTTATGVLGGAGAAYTLTLSGGDLANLNGVVGINLARGQNIVDAAGNPLAEAEPATDETYSVRNDAEPPRIARLVRGAPLLSPTAADVLNWELRFNEDVANVDAGDFTLAGTTGTITGLTQNDARNYTITASGGDLTNLDGTVTLGFATGQDIADTAGNALTDLTSTGTDIRTFQLDHTAPTAAITGPDGPINGAFEITIAFSEYVRAITSDDLTITNGAVTGLTAVASELEGASVALPTLQLRYTAEITPAGEGDVVIALAAGAFSDVAENANTAEASFSVEADATAPRIARLVRGAPLLSPTAADVLNWELRFNEDVANVDAGDFTLAGTSGTITGVTQNDARNYTITASGGDLTNLDGTVSIGFAGGQDIADTAGNALTDLTSTGTDIRTFQLDHTAPTAAITGPSGPVSGAFEITIAFSEYVRAIEAGDLTVTNGAITGLTAVASELEGVSVALPTLQLRYTAEITPAGAGDVVIALAAGAFSDVAENANTAEASFSVEAELTAPRITSIVRAEPTLQSPTIADTLNWSVRFDEAVTNIDAADFAVTGPAGSTISVTPLTQPLNVPPEALAANPYAAMAVSSTDFTVTVSGGDLATFNGLAYLNLAAGQDITDAAGNALTNTTPTGSNVNYFHVDRADPTVILSSQASAPVSGAFIVNVDFIEYILADMLTLDDFVVSNGVASNLVVRPSSDAIAMAEIDGAASVSLEYQFAITITPTVNGVVTVDLPAGAVTDFVGNASEAAAQFSIENDQSRTLTVSLAGVGSGTVTSTPAGIDCGTDCTEVLDLGASVSLTAAAVDGSTFAGWTSGPCASTSDNPCQLTMSADRTVTARFTLDQPPAGRIVASILPGARSGTVGGDPLTAFLSVLSRSSSPAQSCQLTAPAGAPVTVSYQALDGDNNPVGPVNPVFDIANGGSLGFLLSLTPTATADGYEFLPVIECQNASLDPIVGVSSLLLNIGAQPQPDILASGVTPSGDGVIRIANSGGAGVMTAAAINVGAGDGSANPGQATITVSADTGAASLPVSLQVCQIDAATAQCITPRGPTASVVFDPNAGYFFAVFVRDQSSGTGIALDPANARVFLRFTDANGTIRSATSAAVTAPAAAADVTLASSVPAGRWSVLVRQAEGVWPGLARASLFVMEDGLAVMDDGRTVRQFQLGDMLIDAGTDTGRFRAGGLNGEWHSDGAIRLGAPWADTMGEFWGVRDQRSETADNWTDFSGRFGEGVVLTDAGELRGQIGSCSVYAAAPASAHEPAVVMLDGCALSGRYTGLLDIPANDTGAPGLLVVNGERGWRLEQD